MGNAQPSFNTGPAGEADGMDAAIRQIGDSWSLLIVWEALHGTTRFKEFQGKLGVARNILSNRLSSLVSAGVLVKRPIHPGARRLEYRLTERGMALRKAVERIEAWGNRPSDPGASGDSSQNGRYRRH